MVDKRYIICYDEKWRNSMKLSIKTGTTGLSRFNKRLEEHFDRSVDDLLPYIALAALVVALLAAVFVD